MGRTFVRAVVGVTGGLLALVMFPVLMFGAWAVGLLLLLSLLGNLAR